MVWIRSGNGPFAAAATVFDKIEISGVQSNSRSDFQAHLETIPGRVRVRLALLARAEDSPWILETDAIRLTYGALLTSFVRYGLIFVGSGLYSGTLKRVETRLANLATRRQAQVGRSARLMILQNGGGRLFLT